MNYKRLSTRNRVKDARQNEDYTYCKQIAHELNEWIQGGREGVTYKEVTDYLGIRDFVPYKHSTEHRDYWVLANSSTNAGIMFMYGGDIVYLCNFVDDVYRLPSAMVGDSRRVKDEFIDNLWYSFGDYAGRYDEDFEMVDEDNAVGDYLVNESELLENKYSVYKRNGDNVENWEQCIREYFDLIDKTDIPNVDEVSYILEDANKHILNWVLILEKGTDKDVQDAIDFIFDTGNYLQKNPRYIALRNVINEMGIA